jgi:hypothetical protein
VAVAPPVAVPSPPVAAAPPPPPQTPWGPIGLGVLVLLAMLAAAALAARRTFGWLMAPPYARATVDPGETSAPAFKGKTPQLSLEIGRGVSASQAHYPEAA